MHCLLRLGKHSFRGSMKRHRLLITNQKVVELQIEIRHVERKPEQIWCDFGERGHGLLVATEMDVL
jgi:hypothetical protein